MQLSLFRLVILYPVPSFPTSPQQVRYVAVSMQKAPSHPQNFFCHSTLLMLKTPKMGPLNLKVPM